MEMQSRDLVAAALAHWPALARQMGEDPAAWKAAPLSLRNDARVARSVLVLQGPGGRWLVLKHQLRPGADPGFPDAVAAHLEVMAAWPKGAPALHAVEPAAQALVMDYLAATPLSQLLDEAPVAGQEALLRRAGRWLGGFHSALPGERRVFQPGFTLRYLRGIMSEVASGARQVVAPERFLRCAGALCARQAAYEGRETLTAQTHGDLHLRNLVMDDAQCWGIDFAAGRVVPVGHDIARLLVDYAILHAQKDAIPRGEVLPVGASSAFFEGYQRVASGDPSVGLLLRNRVLAEWWGLPVTGRSIAQERRLAGLMPLVGRVFPGI